MALGGTTYRSLNWDDIFTGGQRASAQQQPGRPYWTGTGWVDENGATVGSDLIGSGKGVNHVGNEWWVRDDNAQHWNRTRGGVSALLYDYFLKDLPKVRQNQQTRQDLFNQYTNTLNGAQEADRAYTQAAAQGGRAAEAASIAAMSMGLDPRAAALGARNAASVAGQDAAARAWDPAARAERIANAIGLAGTVSEPMYKDILALIMQYDLALNNANIQDNADDGGFWGDIIGAIGSIGAAAV